MSEFNFDKLRNYKAPDEWAEKTIKVVNEKRRARYYQVKRLRICIACICLILLCMFSFTFCIRVLGNSFITPVNVEETITQYADDNKPINEETDNSIFDYVEETQAQENSEISLNNSENRLSSEETRAEETVTKNSVNNKNEKEDETEKPTSVKKPTKENKKPTSSKKPTKVEAEKENQNNTQKPVQRPVQQSTQRPTQRPVVQPTQKPAQKPIQKPTTGERPKPTQSPVIEIEPTETPVENRIVCTMTINKNQLSDSQKVYCKIYSCDDDVYLGDSDLYSLQHTAEIYSISDDKFSVSYYPAKKGVVNKNGEYIAIFYNENGKNLKVFGFKVNQY